MASRKTDEYPTLVVTKYMGSKKAILPFVARELRRLTKPGDIIVDLMAGTHTIGYAMKERCRIVANDVQHYSLVIGQTLLNHDPDPPFSGAAADAFMRYYLFNRRHLEGLFADALHLEREMLDTGGRRYRWKDYADFCDGYPYYMRPNLPNLWPEEFRMLFSRQRVEAYRTLHKLEPYSLFSLYYANTYLGVRQALEADSLRYAVDKLCDEWVVEHPSAGYDAFSLRCLLMCGLIAALNRINPGPGHWAAFPRVNSANYAYLAAQRSLSLYELFMAKVGEFEAELARHRSAYAPHIVRSEDYSVFMREVSEYIKRARVVYLDPPYSQGHYSRFYHLLETLVLYDYPEISHTGRYRTDRHQSPFSHKGKVKEALGEVCQAAIGAGAVLVISYSHGGIVPDHEAMVEMLQEWYRGSKVKVLSMDSEHSKLGKAERLQTREYLFICRP